VQIVANATKTYTVRGHREHHAEEEEEVSMRSREVRLRRGVREGVIGAVENLCR